MEPMRILFNSDGGSAVLYHFEPPITNKQLCNVVDQLQGTQVDVFIQCVGDTTFQYGTRIGQVFGEGMDLDDVSETHRRMALNLRSLLDRGDDPLDIWPQRTHELGMRFWASLRMNDIHQDWVERWPWLRSRWTLEHPHLLIGEESPDRYRNVHDRSFTYAMDYAHEEVHERKLSIIDEICAGYDVDGIELDFQSHPFYFKRGEESRGMPLMNDFMQRVRARLDEIGKGKGRPLVIQVRVPPSFRECDEVGLDARAWIREGLTDVVVPQTRGYVDMTPDVRAFVEAAQGTDCLIAGGLEHYVRYYTRSSNARASTEMMRAAASACWQQGARAIYLFNFDSHALHFFNPMTAQERQILEEIGDPATLQRKSKHYYVTRDMEARTPEEGGDKQLPVLLTEADPERTFTFTVGDDLEAARRTDDLETVRLWVTFDQYIALEQMLAFRLNGKELRNARVQAETFEFDDAPARQGTNTLSISLRAAGDGAPHPARVEGVELLVVYGNPRAR